MENKTQPIQPQMPAQPDPQLNEMKSPVGTVQISVAPKKSSPLRWILIILALILIVALPIIFILGQKSASNVAEKATISPTPTITATPSPAPVVDTSTWKTYVGDGFSLQYPSSSVLLKQPYWTILNHNILISKQ